MISNLIFHYRYSTTLVLPSRSSTLLFTLCTQICTRTHQNLPNIADAAKEQSSLLSRSHDRRNPHLLP